MIAIESLGHSAAQVRLAAVVWVAGATVSQSLLGGGDNVCRRRGIGLAAHQRHKRTALRLQSPDFRQHAVDGGRLQPCQSIGQAHESSELGGHANYSDFSMSTHKAGVEAVEE